MSQIAVETTEVQYRLVLALPEPGAILLVHQDPGAYRLPSVVIPKRCRSVEMLQQRARSKWGIELLFLDCSMTAPDGARVRLAEVTSMGSDGALRRIGIESLKSGELDEIHIALVRSLLEGRSSSPFAQPGWLAKVSEWLYQTTGKRRDAKAEVCQYHADRGHQLSRFAAEDGTRYWLKATRGLAEQEFAVMKMLSSLAPKCIPKITGFRDDWKAWLAEDAGEPLSEGATIGVLEEAVVAFAALQRRTIEDQEAFKATTLPKRSLRDLREHADALFQYLEEANSQSELATIPRQRLRQLKQMFERACLVLAALPIPETLCHGDLNRGNILWDGAACRFIDWEEAYIGTPFVAFEHLSLLQQDEPSVLSGLRLRVSYGNAWRDMLTPEQIHRALIASPLVAAGAAVYGSGAWLHAPARNDAARKAYASKVCRYMDRIAAPRTKKHAGGLDGPSPETLEIAPQRSARRKLSFALLVFESWWLLFSLDIVLWRTGANGVHRRVRRHAVQPVSAVKRWSIEDLSRAVDFACIFYVKWVRCLQRSAVLTVACRRYGWDVEMVVGGKMYPLSLHAWVQRGAAVVNDGPHVLETYRVLERC